MLRQILHEIEHANGPISLDDLSRQLAVEPGALRGMIQHWVRKGRLSAGAAQNSTCESGCNSGCAGPDNCVHIIKMPRTYAVKLEPEKRSG